MFAVNKRFGIEQYLQEGLLALVPVYENGYRSAVITSQAAHREPRGVPWLLERLAAFYNLDLSLLRRRCAELLDIKSHISMPLNENLVLVPVKVRQAREQGETTMGYVSMLQVKEITCAKDEPPWQTRLLLEGGTQLKAINLESTMKTRMEHGQKVLDAYIKHQGCGVRYKGLQKEDLLKIMPHCDCFLKELAIISYRLG